MTNEDIVAAKLKGLNCLIKFIDGEEMLINVLEIDGNDNIRSGWFRNVGYFMGGEKYSPFEDLVIKHELIKYVKAI